MKKIRSIILGSSLMLATWLAASFTHDPAQSLAEPKTNPIGSALKKTDTQSAKSNHSQELLKRNVSGEQNEPLADPVVRIK